MFHEKKKLKIKGKKNKKERKNYNASRNKKIKNGLQRIIKYIMSIKYKINLN